MGWESLGHAQTGPGELNNCIPLQFNQQRNKIAPIVVETRGVTPYKEIINSGPQAQKEIMMNTIKEFIAAATENKIAYGDLFTATELAELAAFAVAK